MFTCEILIVFCKSYEICNDKFGFGSPIYFTKIGPAWGVDTSGSGKVMGRGCRGVNIMPMLCELYVNGKMRSVGLFQEWGEKR
jgi:hypothetical protein